MTTLNCPTVLANGTCSDSNCSYIHNITTCAPCNMVFVDNGAYDAHLHDKRHRNRVSGRSVTSCCSICNVNVTGGEISWNNHLSGKRHTSKALLRGVSTNSLPRRPGISTTRATFCDICQCIVENIYWQRHIKNPSHLSRETFTRYKSALANAESDKHDIVVTGDFDFGIVDPAIVVTGKQIHASVNTSVIYSTTVLVELKLASAQGSSTTGRSAFSVSVQGSSAAVMARNPLRLIVNLLQTNVGQYEDRLELVFEDTQLKKKFLIARILTAIVGDKADHEALQPRAPYVPRTRSVAKPVTEIIEGIKPPALNAIRYVVQLPQAKVPPQLQTILAGSDGTSKLIKTVKDVVMPISLTAATYGRHFKNLLWVEEVKMEQDLERYEITNARLSRYNNYYYLSVPGLAEKRPSVLVGDRILVQEQGATDGRWFEGHVHVLRQLEVGLQFHGSFSRYSETARFHVRFKLNRIPVRRQHQAMDSAFTEDRILFPQALAAHMTPGMANVFLQLQLHNTLISTNPPQLQAVSSIVALPPGSAPFIVFGPPGTGKTITIVEAIQQVLVANPHARIMACAPSNSAADLIALRLRTTLGPDVMFRFYAASRFKNQVPDELLAYTCTQSGGHFTIPPMYQLQAFRVIISTCVSASFGAGVGMARGHFTHIFVDEAGQATEPELMVSVKTMADSNTNVILSGDPKQLGPIIRSPIARQLGLDKSYLERLMNSEPYDLQSSYGKSVVKLVKNFRSHNSILHFPNMRFYDNELEQCAEASVINTYLNSSYLPTKSFPVVFHAVSGKDEREASSPSFFNIHEITQVKLYVQKLKEDRHFRTTDNDIGIIAPYHAQCCKLRAALRNTADGIKVGSVEEFQGQERKVIIISTVRSSREFVEYDLKHTLGFVSNPRRFNVAVTRAKALLIVVGDPQVLSLDPLWRSFLNYIYLNGGWTGPDITWDPAAPIDEAGGYDTAAREAAKLDMNQFVHRIEGSSGMVDSEDLDANVDRPWRDVE